MLFLDLRFFDSELKLYYKNYQTKSFFQQRIKFEKSFKLRLKKFNDSGIVSSDKTYYSPNLEEYIKEIAGEPKIMLDYGSGEGNGTLFKLNKGVKKILYDPFQNKKNNFVFSNKEKNIKDKKIQFDLITLRNVLEHVSFPEEV
jgi:2-polyprenyl-3-methyl-5-hydroxy-6-metoxy-1,4-benzoquinol methylase